ncbi:MAG: hypothetical protein JWP78_3162 [Mucilaginibacter sp.]|nr:hypothetical protein [Mucilaginibacter sp.]
MILLKHPLGKIIRQGAATTKLGMKTIFEDDLRFDKIKEIAPFKLADNELFINEKKVLIRWAN